MLAAKILHGRASRNSSFAPLPIGPPIALYFQMEAPE